MAEWVVMPYNIWFWLFLHITLSSKISSAQEYTSGDFVSTPLCKRTGIQCADDCLSLLVCGADNPTPLQSVLCAATSSKTPYCTNNGCSATIGTCPTTIAPIFQCTDIGIYPDPKDCTRYRNCEKVGILANYYQCPSGFNFNSKNGLCEKAASCDIIDCSNYLNQIVAFKSDPRFYAACCRGLSGQIESTVYKCSENLIFSAKTQTCNYECVSAGSFKDSSNCHKYFVCSGTVGNFKWTRIECPQGYFFNDTICVRELSTCSSQSNPPDPDSTTTTTTTAQQPTTDITTTTAQQPPVDNTTTTVNLPSIDDSPAPDITTISTTENSTPPVDNSTTTNTTSTTTNITTPTPTITAPTFTELFYKLVFFLAEPPDECTSTTVKLTTKYPITSIPFR